MMRGLAPGGTARPSHARPGNGFGRCPGRPGPMFEVDPAVPPEPEWFDDAARAPVSSLPTPTSVWREVLES